MYKARQAEETNRITNKLPKLFSLLGERTTEDELGTTSTMIVDPVVVIPDILSKKESTNDKSRLENKKGIDPKIAILNQDKVVNRNACCKFNFLFSSRFVSTRRTPIKVVSAAEDKKALFFS